MSMAAKSRKKYVVSHGKHGDKRFMIQMHMWADNAICLPGQEGIRSFGNFKDILASVSEVRTAQYCKRIAEGLGSPEW